MLFLSPRPTCEQRAVTARRQRRGFADQALGSAPLGRGFPRRAAGLRAMESGMFEVACAGVDAALRRTRELSEAAGGTTTDD